LEEVAIVIGRCSRVENFFGIRFVAQATGLWVAVWAFDILEEEEAKRERYGESKIEGTFGFDPDYPGCPYCSAGSIAKCGCGKINCWNGLRKTFLCAWCGSRGKLEVQ
jgi:hypothetical protein